MISQIHGGRFHMSRKHAAYVVLLAGLGAFLVGWFGRGLAFAGNAPLPGSEEDPLVSRAYVDSVLAMKVVEVSPGQSLIGYSGTEIILRAGTATVIDSELGGLCDCTEGVDLTKGANVPINHLLLVPRDDGRGIKATSKVVVMVRGKFDVK